LRRNKWELNLGFVSSLVAEKDEKLRFYFFPKVTGTYEIEKNQLAVIGGFSGGVMKNSLRQFAGTNPFLSYNPNLDISINQFEFNAGIKGKLTGNTGFVARVMYNRFNDLPLFITDT